MIVPSALFSSMSFIKTLGPSMNVGGVVSGVLDPSSPGVYPSPERDPPSEEIE